MIDIEIIKKQAMIELAKREFFFYCHLKAPEFYKRDRDYLVQLCNDMQSFYESDDEVMIVNLPPRMGKSRTAGLFVEWILGRNKQEKIMTGSYNETLSTVFSKSVRNSIQEEKADINKIVYNDIFPDVKIKKGDASMNLWSLESGYNNYLATSPTGTATGFGCSLMVIDDLVKNAEEAFNENVLEKHWNWFTQTMLSRLEEGGKILIIMTRWASKDLAGRALAHFKEEGKKVKHVIKKALQDDGTMLCEEVLSKKSYKSKIKAMGEEIASANYQQIPIDTKGALYQNIKTYTQLPQDAEGNKLSTRRIAYCDTADEGSDYLCNIIADEYQKQLYIIDVYFTKDAMETTEPELAYRLCSNNTNIAYIESNNGGRGFARNVEKEILSKFKTRRCVIQWFHQSKNKKARILSNSASVQRNVYFPVNWRDKFPEFYNHIVSYQKEGKNKNDDGADCLTGLWEKVDETDAILF